MSKCVNPKGHLFEQQKVPLVAAQYFCADCGEVQEYDPQTKSWKTVKKGSANDQ